MPSLYLGRLTSEQRQGLIGRLWEAQGQNCFICEQAIDLDVHAHTLDIDHVEPLSAGGKDDETNFALTHDSCNRS
jgi:5-methylcytosine-specific restriction endonuclease McrA